MDLTAISFVSSSTGLIENVSAVSLVATVTEMFSTGDCGNVNLRAGYKDVDSLGLPVTTATA